jgi:WD40 repeat protein
MEAGKCIKVLEGSKGAPASVVFTPDGRTLVSGSYDNTIRCPPALLAFWLYM